jgi:protein-disulfide isomerase
MIDPRSFPMSQTMTKRQLREQRRAERQAAERAATSRARRRRRQWQLAGAAGLAVAVVAVAVVVSSSGDSAERSPAQAASLLRGVPEHDGVLGDPSAPVTVTEFLDLQCPVCAEASRTLLPTLVNDYVRTGKVKLQARTLHFIGPDSVRAARVAAGAERQGRLWPFVEAFYAVQKAENSGYVTDDFVRSVATASGVDAGAALAYADTAAAQKPLAQASSDATRLGIDGTPRFTVARGNGAPKVVSANDLLTELAAR